MRMSEKCRNNSDNPLTSRRTDGGKSTVVPCNGKVNTPPDYPMLFFMLWELVFDDAWVQSIFFQKSSISTHALR